MASLTLAPVQSPPARSGLGKSRSEWDGSTHPDLRRLLPHTHQSGRRGGWGGRDSVERVLPRGVTLQTTPDYGYPPLVEPAHRPGEDARREDFSPCAYPLAFPPPVRRCGEHASGCRCCSDGGVAMASGMWTAERSRIFQDLLPLRCPGPVSCSRPFSSPV